MRRWIKEIEREKHSLGEDNHITTFYHKPPSRACFSDGKRCYVTMDISFLYMSTSDDY
jgi:hypothetical protein